MTDVVSADTFIMSLCPNRRHFKALLDEIQSEYGDTVYFLEVHCLSKSKVLQRFLSLFEEIILFLFWKMTARHFENASSVCDLAFLTDICGHLNDLNSKMQGKCQPVSEVYNNVSAFRMKLSSIHPQLLNSNTCHFPNCQEIFQQYKTNGGRYGRNTEKLQQLCRQICGLR
jgi:hypothetical protein